MIFFHTNISSDSKTGYKGINVKGLSTPVYTSLSRVNAQPISSLTIIEPLYTRFTVILSFYLNS